MKKVSIKPAMVLALAVFGFAALITSCKKADNPNIIYTSYNKTVTGTVGSIVVDSIDLNLDTKSDFRFGISQTVTGDSIAVLISGGYIGGIYIDSTLALDFMYQVKPLNKNETPANYVPGVMQWEQVGLIDIKRAPDITGLAGSGDKFIPVFVYNTLTSKFHYGWIRVNMSSDHKTFKLIDGAFNLIPDVPVKMGAK
ncbi:MAG: hypothetical protein IPM95_08630 [Sphingobacteriales bacterium]|jgi:hypothetical protein|nr:hypothetical protein [Sphingobacteriales bacterium]